MSVPGICIRRLRPDDREIYCRLAASFYRTDAVLHPIPEERFGATFREMMCRDTYAVGYLFEEDGKAAGYALLARTYSQEAGGEVVWIEELYVLPQYRGRGIGSEFFRRLAADFPAARYRLEAEPENEGALRLYNRFGFRDFPYCQLMREGG